MSTAITTITQPSLALRFVWKEYRMLRGLWLAGMMIGVVLQSLPMLLGAPQHADATFEYFVIAWGAAAIYAIGAAIVVFAAETEDGTRDYLRLLPGDWRSIFATKTLVSLVTAVLLGGALSVSAWWFAGRRGLTASDSAELMGVFGVGVVEFLVWGLLFSMWWKQPLVAAVAAMVCASVGAQVAVGISDEANKSFSLTAYHGAAPYRLLLCGVVFVADVLLGRRWLYPAPEQVNPLRSDIAIRPTSATAATRARPRRRMFSRLLWQTWRESWRSILLVVPLSFALVGAAMLPALIRDMRDFVYLLPFFSLIPPALLGAMVFRADWQRDHRLFLATHSAWPRYVWLARQVVWMGVVVILTIAIHWMFSRWIYDLIMRATVKLLQDGWTGINFGLFDREYLSTESPYAVAFEVQHLAARIARGVLTAWCACIAAYGIGQFCSMLVRQSLVSGFLAVLLSIVLASWTVLMFRWQMNPLWFVLPACLAALLATWLRMPSWILKKNQLQHWLLPAATLVLPLVGTAAMVPSARMAQIEGFGGSATFNGPWNDETKIVNPEAAATALRYEQLAGQLEEFRVPSPGFPVGRKRTEALSKLAEEVGELTREPYCRFPQTHVLAGSPGEQYLRRLLQLLVSESHMSLLGKDFEDSFERLCDRIRLTNHRLQFQPSGIYTSILVHEHIRGDDSFDDLLAWANHPDQTSERITAAIPTLRALFDATPKPEDAIRVDRERFRAVVLETEDNPSNYRVPQLALTLNRWPGEQERALVATDILTRQTLQYVQHVSAHVSHPTIVNNSMESSATQLREILRTTPWSSIFALHESMVRRRSGEYQRAAELAHSCASSLLVAELFGQSRSFWEHLNIWVEEEVRRRALLVQLASIAYHIDHGEYPESLDELTPDYLPQPINDPFSGKAFDYRRAGLSLPLKKAMYNATAGEDPHVPAGTPLFWSVGSGNSKLFEEFEYDPDHNWAFGGEAAMTTQQHDEAKELGQSVYKFWPTERGGHSRNNLVFPLPK